VNQQAGWPLREIATAQSSAGASAPVELRKRNPSERDFARKSEASRQALQPAMEAEQATAAR